MLKNLESETSGNFQRLFKALMRTSAQLEAKDLMNAIDGLGYYFNNSIAFFNINFSNKNYFYLGTNEAALIGKFNV